MGITGELVRKAFSKSLSLQMRYSHARSYAVEKKRWSSVVADDDLSSFTPAIDEGEFTSVYAEAETASIRSSEATVNQPLAGDFKDQADAESNELRICSKKKQIKANSNETGVRWSWLERWIATRLPENAMMEDQRYKQIEAVSGHQTNGMRKRLLDIAMEEKESCGSNDVSLRIEVGSIAMSKDIPRPTKNRNKTTGNISKRDAASCYLCPREPKVHLSTKAKIVQRNK
ncbi:Hypothetical predicted protein [Olea europaea subsp. europaea]|uniref:Uncharacterized protein n=1 Tax=Olea europaea subsp. europaea TaxID=158383 RepID=A0A8S0T058_OLEEU|nr:Hypothetical predicted protein [Olea europaea subsp. europaea]